MFSTCTWLIDSDIFKLREDVLKIELLELVEKEVKAEDAHVWTAPLNLLYLKLELVTWLNEMGKEHGYETHSIYK